MGMPISLALRGRHADDDRGARRLGARRWPCCARSTGSSAPTAPTRASPGWAAARSPSPTARPRSPRCSRSASGRGARVRRRVRRPAARPDGGRVLDPSGVVKGWAVERAAAHLRALPDTDFCLSAGGDMVCRTARPGRAGRGGSGSRTRATRAGVRRRRPGPHRRGRHLRHRPPRRAPRRRPHRPTARPASPRSPSSAATSPGPTSTPPPPTPSAPTPRAGCAPAGPLRPGGLGRRPHGALRRPQVTPDELDRAVSRFS